MNYIIINDIQSRIYQLEKEAHTLAKLKEKFSDFYICTIDSGEELYCANILSDIVNNDEPIDIFEYDDVWVMSPSISITIPYNGISYSEFIYHGPPITIAKVHYNYNTHKTLIEFLNYRQQLKDKKYPERYIRKVDEAILSKIEEDKITNFTTDDETLKQYLTFI